ncbi:protease complex subunit PrcB family protein [Marinobacter salexigens]|uniref:protease complex subunit PrcB family protein n=1 Tax=Marinobacter salexigens TaxID=1925763 RepID=UPI0013748456|nr:protease complex subunit PrcB family protein [Marinobacter salexigens]
MATLLAGGLVLAGCASSEVAGAKPDALMARQVIQSAHCGLSGPGLAYVETSERLQQLLDLPAQNMAVQQLRQVDLEKEHLLFVTLGEKPTGGYSVSLSSATAGQTEGSLRLLVAARSPAPGTMTTQVITSPCVVIAVPASDWSEVRVSGVRDKDLVLKP